MTARESLCQEAWTPTPSRDSSRPTQSDQSTNQPPPAHSPVPATESLWQAGRTPAPVTAMESLGRGQTWSEVSSTPAVTPQRLRGRGAVGHRLVSHGLPWVPQIDGRAIGGVGHPPRTRIPTADRALQVVVPHGRGEQRVAVGFLFCN